MKQPSSRFARHTKDDDAPGYFEDFWIWDCHQGFENFVFQSPAAKIAAELLSAKKINLVMDNWFFREAGSKSGAPFHHDISYFDFEGSICVLWLPLDSVKKHEGIAWIKGSHLWNKLFLRTRFKDGHQEDGEAGEVNGKTYHLTPDILNNKQDYEFLAWDFELGDCVFFDMRTLHGSLNQVMPGKNVHRYTLRMAKEGSKVGYRGAWAQAERTIMEANGYQNGDELSGKMFPTLYEN
ncbi:MAG: phytanoyl-CoA dioxygenase family protein [Oceanospirillaceae bacterium]